MTPVTQRNAYDSLENKTVKQELVFRAIDSYNGLCLFELVNILGWPVNTITGRLNELVKQGKVKDSGETRVNPKSKKRGIKWVVK